MRNPDETRILTWVFPIDLQLLHVARPRFYAIDDLENQELPAVHDDRFSFRAYKANKEKFTSQQRDRQQRPEAKESFQFRNIAVVKTYPTDRSAIKEKLEDMRKLLTTIRRRVSTQQHGNASN